MNKHVLFIRCCFFILNLIFYSPHNLQASFYKTSQDSQYEYLYPVAIIIHEEQEKICVIHQKNMSLDLWFWDPITGKAYKGLSSIYNPAGLRALPSKKACSFIQNDAIRIKEIDKRSAGYLDMYGPYDISMIEWVDNEHCYFSARYRETFQLFCADKRGNVAQLTSGDSHKVFPQKQGPWLFFIERCTDGKQQIGKIAYNVPLMEEAYSEYQDISESRELDVLYVWGVQSMTMSFLTMKNDLEGFFLCHPSILDKNQDRVKFQVFSFFYNEVDKEWQSNLLFSFFIPLFLINGYGRLYESMYPLLPRYVQDDIWYVNERNEDLLLCKFNKNLCKSFEMSVQGSFNFSPCFYKGKVYYGGAVSSFCSLTSWYDLNIGYDEHMIVLPYISIK